MRKKMKKVLFAFAAMMALAACGNKQAAAPETESSEVKNEVVTNDTISQEMKEANMQQGEGRLQADGCERQVRDLRLEEIRQRMDAPERNPDQ